MAQISFRLPDKLNQAIEEILPQSTYKTKSDLCRTLLRWWVEANRTEKKVLP